MNSKISTIPNYSLYGEEKDEIFPDILHCESIAARSSRHDWTIAPHRHHALHQFFYLQSGGGRISIEGKQHLVSTPTVISLPALTVHGFEFERNTRGTVVTLPKPLTDEILSKAPDIRYSLSKPVIVPGTERMASSFENLTLEHGRREAGRQQYLSHMAGLLAIEVGRAVSDLRPGGEVIESRREILVREFLSLLEQHFRSFHTVTDYAHLLKMTPPHLTRCCRQVVGKSASVLIQDRLILEAKRALVYTRMPVSELAYSLGFSDPAHFSKFFQLRVGFSPSEFRKKADPQTVATRFASDL